MTDKNNRKDNNSKMSDGAAKKNVQPQQSPEKSKMRRAHKIDTSTSSDDARTLNDKTASEAPLVRDMNRKTMKTKHVELEKRPRPKITPTDDSSSKQAAGMTRHRGSNKKSQTRKKPSKMLIIPLGGLDGIGKNMTAFVCDGDMVLVDAGLMFPDDDHPGVDLILPDYTYVLENEEMLRAIIITHGHEDHTGALPYLLKDLSNQVPIYGTKLTLGLVEGKLNEHRIKANLNEIKGQDHLHIGCFDLDFFSVNHSIPGALGYRLTSPAGTVVHTGDFKLDQTPIDGITTDFGSLARFAGEGVDLFLSDSTNAQRPGFTPSEAEVGKSLRSIIENAKGRVIIASFASHIHRLQQIADAAVANGRKVVVTGRSMVQNTDIARHLGYLNIQDIDIMDAYDLKGTPSDKVVIMCTGSQGEPLSALARIANGEHKTIQIDPGDTVIISATPVPGNEKAVTRVVNALCKLGVDVWDKNRAMVHVSGHASQEELKLILSVVQPNYFMPVHGEAAHLRAHAKLAALTGVAEDHIFICDNGESLVMEDGVVTRGEIIENGIVYVDGLSVGDTSRSVLDERTALSSNGVAMVSAAVDMRRRRLLSDVRVDMKGITGSDVTNLCEECRESITRALGRGLEKGTERKDLEKIARDTVFSILWERIKQRPVVIASVLDVQV